MLSCRGATSELTSADFQTAGGKRRRGGEAKVVSPHTEPRSIRQRVGAAEDEGTASEVLVQCTDILRSALDVVPFGDSDPADMSGSTLKTPLSGAQLLFGVNRLYHEDDPKPSEETVFRWTAETLTAIAAVNRARTTAAVQALADVVKELQPDTRRLPSPLLLRHGPAALMERLSALPTRVDLDLSNLTSWMQAAASMRDIAARVSGWKRILAALERCSAAEGRGVTTYAPVSQLGDGLEAEVRAVALHGGHDKSRRWHVLTRVRCLSRETRTVSKLTIAEPVSMHSPCATCILANCMPTTFAGAVWCHRAASGRSE